MRKVIAQRSGHYPRDAGRDPADLWFLSTAAAAILLLGGCTTSTKLVTRTPDPSLMVPCETPAAIPAKPTGNQIDKALVDTTRIALDCKSRHDGLIEFENAAPKP